jgi:hypothetical protein
LGGLAGTTAAAPAEQTAADRVEVTYTIVDLQQFRQASSIAIGGDAGGPTKATLVNLNPAINAWFLLTLDDPRRGETSTYHLENARPEAQRLALEPAGGGAIGVLEADRRSTCAIWAGQPVSPLERARRSGLPFAPLCDGRLYLRNTMPGSRTTLEATTEFLRDHVWQAERIIGFVRQEFFRDAFIERAVPEAGPEPSQAPASLANAPQPAGVRAEFASRPVVAGDLGLDLGEANQGLLLGQWYAVRGLAGVYASAIEPAALSEEPGPSPAPLRRPDSVEAGALSYLVAFDLAEFDLGFALGTDHPRLGWSNNLRSDARVPGLPGPDGIDSASPLVRAGMISPMLEVSAVATFTGGFKREHGAFRYGPLASRNHGSHYGFIEQGVVFSRLVPGLATIYELKDGTIGMKTWTDQDEQMLPRLRHARQNGVPLLEVDPVSGQPVPGALVNQWGPGNWSGSATGQLRTLRAGACLLEHGTERHLVYGYFSTTTPPTMARIFLAYGCRYAMLLDMNALEHTYLALYSRQGSRMVVQHLVKGMEQLDKESGGALLPRFLAFPDNRDFFYLVRRGQAR